MRQRQHWPSVTNQHRQKKMKKRKLAPLKFNSAFFRNVGGEFENTCQNVEFTPAKSVNAIIKTPVEKYKLLQFHFHWGRGTGEGTEHLVNGNAEEFEIHFVSVKIGGEDPTAGDARAVIAVRGS
jgi:carbonic anhydrase